jgi:HisJ family histidinol phosphate phosphatase
MLKINHDFHVHTYLSSCCADERQLPVNIVPRARELGIERIGFTDHLWANPAYPPNDFYLPQTANQIKMLREILHGIKVEGVKIYVGCEAEMIGPGKFGILPELAESLDFVVLATDHFHFKGFVEQPAGESDREIAEHMLKFFKAGAQCQMATILAHPCFPLGYMERYDSIIATVTDNEFLDAFHVAAESGVALEITVSFLRDPSKNRFFSLETPVRVLSLAKQAGCKFVFGSDSHTIERLSRIHELEYFIRTVGLTEEDIHPFAKI